VCDLAVGKEKTAPRVLDLFINNKKMKIVLSIGITYMYMFMYVGTEDSTRPGSTDETKVEHS